MGELDMGKHDQMPASVRGHGMKSLAHGANPKLIQVILPLTRVNHVPVLIEVFLEGLVMPWTPAMAVAFNVAVTGEKGPIVIHDLSDLGAMGTTAPYHCRV
jgi:hypothetical protein